MQAKPTLYVLGTCLLAATAAAGATRPSWFEAAEPMAEEWELIVRGEFTAASASTARSR
jgi:hypothetical protein